jgi:hypothetical protein
MNNGAEYQHWSEAWEDNVSAVLSEQDAIQADIADGLRRGDLLDASTSAFQHVLTSYELGDPMEAQAYMLAAIAFAHADVMLQSERETPASILFDIPKVAQTLPLPVGRTQYVNLHRNGIGCPESRYTMTQEQYDEQLAINKAVVTGIASSEAIILLGTEADSLDANKTIGNTVIAVCNLMVSDHARGDQTSAELLLLAKKLSDHLVLNIDEESTAAAYSAFESLMYAGIAAERKKTVAALNKAIWAFTQILDGPFAEEYYEKCQDNLKLIKKAKQQRVVNAALVQPKNFYYAYEPYLKGTNDFGKLAYIRTSRDMQRKAISAQRELSSLVLDPDI